MEFFNCVPFLAALVTVFLIFVRQSGTSSIIGESMGHSYQEEIDDFDRKAAIGGAGNVVIELGQTAVDAIKKNAAFYNFTGAYAEGVDALTEGFVLTIKLIAQNGDDAFDLIDKYKGIYISDPEEAIDDIDRGMRTVKQSIYHSGVPILHALGAVGIITPGVTKSKIKESLDPIQDSGTAIFDSVYAAQVLAVQGLKSSKRSRDQGLKAAHSAIVAGACSLYSSFIKAAKYAFAYIDNVAKGKIKEVDATADALSSRAKAVARDAETLSVINGIESGIAAALKEGLCPKILNEIRQGVLADIESSAMGFAAAFKSIEEARKLEKADYQKALRAIKDGFDAARKGCIDGSVQGYQGFGGAAHLVGQRKVFSVAIELIESSRISTTEGIEAARKLANMGVISGGDSTEYGLTSSHDALEALEIELFTKISNAQNVALKVLKAVTKLPGLV